MEVLPQLRSCSYLACSPCWRLLCFVKSRVVNCEAIGRLQALLLGAAIEGGIFVFVLEAVWESRLCERVRKEAGEVVGKERSWLAW